MIRSVPFFKWLAPKWEQSGSNPAVRQISTAGSALKIIASPSLWAAPLKPKKKIDPNLIKIREARKKKKLEKEIKRLQKFDKQLKPITEVEVPIALIENKNKRKRVVEVSERVTEERLLLFKQWSAIKYRENNSDILLLDRLLFAQQQALDELRLESKELYDAAVQIDNNLIPFKYSGPAETPPKKDYFTPDGDYTDISKKWV